MRRIVAIAALAVGLAGGAARAGVYAPQDPPARYPPLPYTYREMRLVLDPLRAAAIPVVPDQPAAGIRRLADELESKPADQATVHDRIKLGVCRLRLGEYDAAVRVLDDAAQRAGVGDPAEYLARLYLQEAEREAKAPADLSSDDRLTLGACYIRLGRFDNAITALSAADQSDFRVLADLAAAYAARGELDRAVAYQEQALDAWPSVHPGWGTGQLMWFRRADGYQLKLYQLRQREAKANPVPKPWDTMDALFDRPRGPGAEYQAEMQPWKLWGDAPPDAYPVVSQLLLWSPGDDRLYWQLAELLNTMGNVQDAYEVLDELVNTRTASAVRDVQAHRRILKESLPLVGALNDVFRGDPSKFQMDFHQVMWAVSPRGMLLPPVGGDLANETAMAARAEEYARQAQQRAAEAEGPRAGNKPGPPVPAAGWWPDWRTLFIGFAAGLIVATLAALQWMEMRRRRAAAHPPPRTEPAVHDAAAFRADAPADRDRVEGAP
jgi:tetratricopeptide (TPR) repeat protein